MSQMMGPPSTERRPDPPGCCVLPNDGEGECEATNQQNVLMSQPPFFHILSQMIVKRRLKGSRRSLAALRSNMKEYGTVCEPSERFPIAAIIESPYALSRDTVLKQLLKRF